MKKTMNSPRRTNNSLIAQLRIERGLTQEQLAELVGVAQTNITRWETGGRKPKASSLYKIAQALDVEPITLIEYYEGK